MVAVRVSIKIDNLQRFNAEVIKGFGGVEGPIGSGPFEDMRRQWAARYSAFASKRYSTFSRGGGDWPPLALSTIRARRGPDQRRARAKAKESKRLSLGSASSLARDTRSKAGREAGPLGRLVSAGGRRVAILVDTGLLKNAVAIGGAGNKITRTPRGLRYGFAFTPHVTGKAKGHPTMSKIAAWHHFGLGHNPKREILVAPDAGTQSGMVADANRAIRKAQGGGR